MIDVLPWHASQWNQLLDLIQSDRLPHALLLQGAPGSGKSLFADLLAQFYLCTDKQQNIPCGQCRSCLQFDAQTHPDMKTITLEEKAKQIKIDQIRESIDYIQQTAQYGQGKVTLIKPAEQMNLNAANALLKSLEEPAKDNLIILQADLASRLLPTVRSRCFTMSFSLPPTSQACEWLKTQVDGVDAQQALSIAHGQPLLALELAESGGLERIGGYKKDLMGLLNGQITPLALSANWVDQDLPELINWLHSVIVSMTRASATNHAMESPWGDYLKLTNSVELLEIERKIIAFKQLINSVSNPNLQLALDQLVLETCEVFR